MDEVELWTDGACQPNPGYGGWAALLRCRNHERLISGELPESTNNRAELTAVIEGLKALKRRCRVVVYLDSEYVANVFLKGWSSRKNLDLWRKLHELESSHDVRWQLVKGHSGIALNERVDQVAEAIAARQRIAGSPPSELSLVGGRRP